MPRSDEGSECDWGAQWDFYDMSLLAITPGGLLDQANKAAQAPCLPGHRVLAYELDVGGGAQTQVTRGFVRNLGPITLVCTAGQKDASSRDLDEARTYNQLAAELHAARKEADALGTARLLRNRREPLRSRRAARVQ